jgi:hypothetical protein
MMDAKSLNWIVLCFIAIAIQAFGKVEGDLQKSFHVGKGGKLILETDIGAIDVKTHGKNEVNIDIEFKAKSSQKKLKQFLDELVVDFQQNGDDVTIEAEYNRDHRNFWNSIGKHVKVQFSIVVPEQYNLDLSTSGGSISVSDLEGEVEGNTSGGGLYFGSIKGPVIGRTSGGGVSVKSCQGAVNVKTSGGSIELGEVKGDVYARTSGGSISVDEVKGSIDACTSGGTVSAVITKQPEGDCQMKTSGGSITISIIENAKIDLDAKTNGGGIKTDFPITVQGEFSSNSLRGEVNGGGPLLYLRTSGGSIYLKKVESDSEI